MSTFLDSMRVLFTRATSSWSLAGLCLLSAGTASAQLVDIANGPLYGGRQPHPNVAVTTSVEFPTVSAAYRGITYDRTATYQGYFNPLQCYKYQGNTSNGYFSIHQATTDTTNHECAGNNDFAGNMMNWAMMSAIDEFRYALTGGNRISENGSSNGTVLERAYLPDGTVSGVPDYFNGGGGYFPTLTLNGAFSSALTNVLPNSISAAGTVYITTCGTQMYFYSSAPGGSCVSPSASGLLASYHVAVNVCDGNEGSTRTDLCLQYGGTNGKYKPVGQVQINAAQMRFAAFGYLMDRNVGAYTVPSGCNDGTGWNRCRYGGVLRAPMKYVGPTTYDAAQASSPNTKAEINTDGSLATDPEGTASTAGGTNSGMINFINKFGSGTNALNPGVGGVYKRLDPGGEMFYEAVRYFQNLGPTNLAFNLLPSTTADQNAVKDYYPITTTWTDPIGSSCSANYIINLSDSNTWDDQYVPGFAGTPAVAGSVRPSSRAVEGGLDAVAWTQKIGLLESTTTSIATNDVDPSLANVATSYADVSGGQHGTYFPAGIAYWANTNDIRTDLAGKQTIKTISFDVNEPGSKPFQDRQLYLMGKYGGFTNTIDRTTDTYANPFWATDPTNPLSGPAIRSNSEWADSTGMPTNYIIASDPSRLINGLRAAFTRIAATQPGTLTGAGLTSSNLTLGSSGAYIATFNSTRWSGSVLFETLSVDSNGLLVVSSTPVWDAGVLLTTRCGTIPSGSLTCTDLDVSANKRNIFTTIKPVAGNRTAVPFSLLGITTDVNYLLALNTNPATQVADAGAQARINYLRGFRGDEASALQYRLRDSPMGDIVNSGPVYVGPPSATIPDSDYQTFYFANASRTPAVYVGANDGMLHAFRASDGFELFGYIPNYSYKDLNTLTNPGYGHNVFVDTVPKIQEVKLSGTWKTVLVGANGNGAQGVFGLDVTDPTAFGTSKVLFEFSDADDADLGSVVATPEIAKLWVSGTAAAPVYRYFAVVTSYNKKRTTVNGRTDTSVSTDTNNASTLFLIALDHVLGSAWVNNVDYYKFNFFNSTTNVAANPNGLGAVTLLLSKAGDLTTSYMYFGDLQGNLWKFDTTGGTPSSWKPVLGTVAAPLPIFVAKDSTNKRQPITARPELASGPFGSTLVYFGTGEYLGTSDLSLPATAQSEYSLLDVNPSVLISRSSDLVARTGSVVGTNVQITGAAFSYTGPSAKKGWYLDFPSVSVGERSITKPAIRTGLLTFTTLTLSNDLCAPGNGYIYQVDALSGLPFSNSLNGNTGAYASTVGIPGPPRVVDLTINSGAQQATGEVINKKTQTTLVSGTSGNIAGFGNTTAAGAPVANPTPPTQEINWREITNFNDRTGR